VLAAAEGLSNTQIAELVGCSRSAMTRWRGRYAAKGLASQRGRPEVRAGWGRLAALMQQLTEGVAALTTTQEWERWLRAPAILSSLQLQQRALKELRPFR
jgi:transposase